MKVKDLLAKEFENIDVKKVEIFARQRMLKRKHRSFLHQKDIIAQQVKEIISKLRDEGYAFNGTDAKHSQEGENVQLGWYDWDWWYAKKDPAIEPTVKYLRFIERRNEYLTGMIDKLKRQLRGISSAITRKRRSR